MQLSWCESLCSYAFDALVEMTVQKDVIVHTKAWVKLVKETHSKLMHVMTSFHKEDAMEQVKVLL